MEVKIKKLHTDAVIPTKAHADDAGFDLTAVSYEVDKDGNHVYHTGLAFEIPKGYVGLLFPRSSNAKKDLILSNSVGVLDSCYRGEVTFKFKPSLKHDLLEIDYDTAPYPIPNYGTTYDKCPKVYHKNDRIGQLIIIPYPEIEFKEVDELSETDRGSGGYGSSGR